MADALNKNKVSRLTVSLRSTKSNSLPEQREPQCTNGVCTSPKSPKQIKIVNKKETHEDKNVLGGHRNGRNDPSNGVKNVTNGNKKLLNGNQSGYIDKPNSGSSKSKIGINSKNKSVLSKQTTVDSSGLTSKKVVGLQKQNTVETSQPGLRFQYVPQPDKPKRMAFRVRSSKFRHVYGVAPKKELCYENIKISKNAHDGNFCAVNPKFFACVIESAGGGQFIVIPLDKTGRVDINCPKVCGHSGPVLDIKWNPFNDHIIASSSDDATIKVWQIPDNGLHGNLTEWMVDLHGHTRRVGYIEWHPTAENILLSAGYDYNCILWNTETAEPINIISCHQDTIFHIAWNRDGSLFATTCKDKKLRVIDPRQGVVVGEVQSHLGTKASKVTFLAEKNRLFTTGFSKMSERQIAVWDLKNFTKPLKMDSVDSSSGIVFPYFDFDTNVVFLAGKGDGNIRYFEIVKDPPYMHYLSQYQSGAPQRGLGVLPKRGVDTSRCEIMRFYKLHTARACCEPISMIVPRKSEMFQEDLFPPTASICASLSADEWISGQNRDPILVSLKDGQIVSTPKSTTAKAVQRKDGSLTTPTITTYKAVRRGDSQTGVKRQLSNTTNTSESVEKVPASVKNIAKLSSENNNNTDIRKSSSTENVDVNDKIGMFENRRTSQSSPKSNQTARQSWTTSYNRTISDEIPATNGIGKSENEKIHVKKTWQPAQSPSSPEPMENGGHPTSITELRQAYFSQIKEIDALKEQLHLKERRIRQLEEELRLTGIDDEGIGESNC